MTTKEEVKRIVDKYNESFSELSNNAIAKEFKTVMKLSQTKPTNANDNWWGWKRLMMKNVKTNQE